MLKLISSLFLVLALAACGSTGVKLGESSSLEILVTYGALKAIEKSDDPTAKAARIQSVAEEFLTIAQSESVRSSLLGELLQEIVAERNLTPADMYLVSQVDPLIEFYAGEDGLIVGERKEALIAFLEDIIQATSLYG